MNISCQPLVSVVTPVHNGEGYLSECIESVLAQTYTNWEYLIIDNCSTDSTLEIAQYYAQKDSRIRIHNNEKFVSALENHHIGFRQMSAESKYCKVLHADDMLFPECLMRMVEVAEANPSVGIVGAYRLDQAWVNLDGLPYPSTIVPGREICRLTLLGSLYVFGSPTSLLIRASLLRQREMFYDGPNFPMHWDMAACYESLQTCDFGFVHQVLTYTRRHKEAQSSFAQKVNSYIVENIRVLKKYGPIYLNHAEYERCLRRGIDDYYLYLLRSIFLLRGKQFWDYHRNSLKTFDRSLISGRLIRVAVVQIAKAFLGPIEFSKKITRLAQEYRDPTSL